MRALKCLAAASLRYGQDPQFVFGGGGNTSFKTDSHLYIKPSGVSLATIEPEQFVKVLRSDLATLLTDQAPDETHAREAWVKDRLQAAVCADSSGRPSVETPVHDLMPQAYVVHTHSTLVNGLLCSQQAKAKCAELFPEVLWIDYTDPGFTLALVLAEQIKAYTEAHGKAPAIVVQEHHGIFVGGDSIEEIDASYDGVLDVLRAIYAAADISTELAEGAYDSAGMAEVAPALRTQLGQAGRRAVIASAGTFTAPQGPLTPDHIVYAKSFPFVGEPTTEALAAFSQKHGYAPTVLQLAQGVACAGDSLKSARLARDAARNGALIEQLSQAFGGPAYLDDRERGFIENWEVEMYRKKVSAGSGGAGRLDGKVALVTGAAQGFGKGIATGLAAEGATVIIADLNVDGAQAVADELCAANGAARSTAVAINIADEAAVIAARNAVLQEFGGLDLLVANAGVLKAGPVDTFDLADWEFVTKVNYTGYFLCAKHFAPLMARQWQDGAGGWSDIVQINSKSGLVGSKANAAYAGSKFGTLGLTQSFALEFVSDGIKVNAICPGNFFAGPLWMDPERGLFKQYLEADKVPGAKTVEDVRAFYEAKVPMSRGCEPRDVVVAILYAVEQQYETGQAIPVTGGQVMD